MIINSKRAPKGETKNRDPGPKKPRKPGTGRKFPGNRGTQKPGNCQKDPKFNNWEKTRAAYAAQGACQHCHERPISRPRKLCSSCYWNNEIRAQYVSTSKFAGRPADDFYGQAEPCPAPTSAPGGSGLKIIAMQERAAARQALHHSRDNRKLINEGRPERATGEIGHRDSVIEAAAWEEFISRKLPASLR